VPKYIAPSPHPLATGDPHTQYATNTEFDDHNARHEPGGGDAMAVDAVAATGSLRTLGTGAQQAAVGTHVTPAMTATVAGHVPVPPNDATKFLDGTGVFSAPVVSPNIKQTEQDFGATAVSEATFTVVDADVSGSSQIIAQLAYVAPTDKAIEEVYMEQPMKIACAPGTGQFDMLVQTEGDVSDKFVFVYLVG